MTASPRINRVLQVHTRYRQAGGEDQVVEAERALLEGAGVSVEQLLFDNADLAEARSLAGDVRLAAGAVWSRSAERKVRAAVISLQPDVVHVHNTFAAASPAVFRGVGDRPVVQTLHNYRWVCPVAITFRDGNPCTDCVGRAVALPAIVHACVRGSRIQSAVATATIAVHRAAGTLRRIDELVALTSFQRQVMIDGGLPAGRIRVVPNFHEPDPGIGDDPRAGVLYIGRLAVEKGIAPLLQAGAMEPGTVRIAGSGPLRSAVEASADAGHIVDLGSISSAAVLDEMRRSIAVVIPSIWFEGFPLVLLQAYATGTPVIASRIGSLAELVEDGVTGLLARADDPADLAGRIRWAVDHPAEMATLGLAARDRYLQRYRGANHLEALLDLYSSLTARRAATAHA
ncbi:MAG: glycosyltransferase family 4 protein [Chloroflexota bacterium]